MSYGILIAIVGPMFAGKSETIIKAITTGEILNHPINKPLVFKHSFDQERYDGTHIVSHNQNKIHCKLLDDTSLVKLQSIDKRHDWVFIDEAQFFSKKLLLEACYNLLDKGVNICCAGLNQDSFGKPFGAMGEILALADNIITIYSTCSICGLSATKTKRLTESTETILVGGDATYEPRCRLHWQ